MTAQRHLSNPVISNRDLMEVIRLHPVIYDKSCDDPLLKRDAWAAVAEELGIEPGEAQARYGNVRTVFSRHLKALRRRRPGASSDGATGRLDEDVRLKDGFEYLRWLIRYIKPRNTGGANSRRKAGGGLGPGTASMGDADNSSCEDGNSSEGVGEDATGSGGMWADLLKEAFVDSGFANVKVDGSSDRRTGAEPNAGTSGGTGSSSSASAKVLTPGGKLVTRAHLRAAGHRQLFPVRAKRPWSASAVGEFLGEPGPPAAAAAAKTQTADEDTLFCLSLAPKMRRLPERFKTAAQLRILQVICDFEMSEASPPPVSP